MFADSGQKCLLSVVGLFSRWALVNDGQLLSLVMSGLTVVSSCGLWWWFEMFRDWGYQRLPIVVAGIQRSKHKL